MPRLPSHEVNFIGWKKNKHQSSAISFKPDTGLNSSESRIKVKLLGGGNRPVLLTFLP